MRRVKQLNIFIFILIGFIVLGVGYAAINNVNLIINGTGSVTATQSNFDVRFLDIDGHRPSILPGSPNTVNVLNDAIATFDVSTLSKKGDTATATIDVKNESNGVGARIGLNLTNSNEKIVVQQKVIQQRKKYLLIQYGHYQQEEQQQHYK